MSYCVPNSNCVSGGGIAVLLGKGDGSFQPAELAVGDFNGDGKPDLTQGAVARTFAILLNTTKWLPGTTSVLSQMWGSPSGCGPAFQRVLPAQSRLRARLPAPQDSYLAQLVPR
jgi:hypothetical protein